MDQPNLAEGLPGVFTRLEGSPSLGLGVLKLLLIDVTHDYLLGAFVQLLFSSEICSPNCAACAS
jgi:hypothetical protein